MGLGIWDAAALIPIVIEAGGRYDDVEAGAAGGPVSLSTNGLVHDDVIAILRG